MIRSILFTCRHPGPVAEIVTTARSLATEFQVNVLFTDNALRVALDRFGTLLSGVNVFAHASEFNRVPESSVEIEAFVCVDFGVEPDLRPTKSSSATQLALDDNRGILSLVRELAHLVNWVCPDVVVRTTPSTLIGPDEVVATAAGIAENSSPILCYQDDYGIGNCLRANEHPLLHKGTHVVLVRDAQSKELVQELTGIPAYIVKSAAWVAPKESFSRQRDGIRANLETRTRKAIYALSGEPGHQSLQIEEIERVLAVFDRLNTDGFESHLSIRPHPRSRPELLDNIASMLKSRRLSFPFRIVSEPFFEALCGHDLFMSAASDMNIESLYFWASDPNRSLENATVSLYIADKFARALATDVTWVTDLSPHQVVSGSVIANYSELSIAIKRSLFDDEFRRRRMVQSSRYYDEQANSSCPLLSECVRAILNRGIGAI